MVHITCLWRCFTDRFKPIVQAKIICLFAWVEGLCPSQQLCSCVRTFSWVEPVLSNEDEVSCSRTQQCAHGKISTHDLAIKSLVLYQRS